MARSLSALTTILAARDDVTVIPLLELRLWRNKFWSFPGLLLVRLSDLDRYELGHEWLGLITELGDLSHGLDKGATFDITIANDEPVAGAARFSDLIRHGLNDGIGTYDVHYADATLILLLRDAQGRGGEDDEFTVARLVAEEPVDLSGTDIQIRFSGVELLLDLQDGGAGFRELLPDRWLTSGFEEQNISITVPTPWNLATGSGNLSLVSSPVRSGIRALRCAVTAATGAIGHAIAHADLPNQGRIVHRSYMRPVSLPSVDVVYYRSESAGTTQFGLVIVRSSGVVRLQNAQSLEFVDSAIALATGAWYRIEVREFFSTTVDGDHEVKVYEEDQLTPLFTLSLTGQPSQQLERFWWGVVTTATWEVLVDDVAMEFYPANVVHDYIGPGRIALVPLAGSVAPDGWTAVGDSPNVATIDDVPGLPDDATTYLASTSLTATERYAHAGLAASGVPAQAFIRYLHLMARHASTVGSAGPQYALYVRDELNQEVRGPAIEAGGLNWRTTDRKQHHIVKVAGKSRAQVDAYTLGLTGTGAGNTEEKRVTALWMNVEYRDDPGIGAGIPP